MREDIQVEDNKMRLPQTVGEGGIFAFSGMDGPTDSSSGYVATWAEQPPDLLIHTPRLRVLSIFAQGSDSLNVQWATGDVCVFGNSAGHTGRMLYTAWHTLIGELPSEAAVKLSFADNGELVADEADRTCWITMDSEHGDCVTLLIDKRRWAMSYGRTPSEAAERAAAGLHQEIGKEIAKRLNIYQALPVLADPSRDELLRKCVSVMKVNTMSGEGALAQHWSTPDRVPHRDMWLWDTVYHSLAMNKVDAPIAWSCLKTMLTSIREDGMMPHRVASSGRISDLTQPPLLAWGVWEHYRIAPDPNKLRFALPYLQRYLQWNLMHRDANGNGLPEWKVEGDIHCRSGESGMDNSARFDDAEQLDAVDFAVFMVHDMRHVALIAEVLGEVALAAIWANRAEEMQQTLLREMWNEADGFFYDKRFDGSLSRVQGISGFLPLLLDGLPAAMTERLLDALADPRRFGAVYPIPSLSLSDPKWSTDMWRGPTWINMNYLIILGLRKQGKMAEATRLRDQTIALVKRYYERYGVTFEYYDATDRVPPTRCERKGPYMGYDIRRKLDAFRDYHWTAALTACLLLESEQEDQTGAKAAKETLEGHNIRQEAAQ